MDNKKICPECGEANEISSSHCKRCGGELSDLAVPSEEGNDDEILGKIAHEIEGENHIDRLTTRYAWAVPILFIIEALAILLDSMQNFLSLSAELYWITLVGFVAEVGLVLVLLTAVRTLKKAIGSLLMIYAILEILLIPFCVFLAVWSMKVDAQVIFYAVWFYYYPITVLVCVVSFILSGQIINNYNGRLERIGWIILIYAILSIIYVFVYCIVTFTYSMPDEEWNFYDGIVGLVLNGVGLYLYFEMFQLLRPRKA
jgi:hypothetical protein